MKLTKAQIEKLYLFTRQHYVEYYDVQTELVDHMANDIEAIWQENPKLTFVQARDQSFKKFGVFGFMDVLQAKEKQMNKRYAKLIFSFIKEWFQLPKIFLTAIIFFAFFKLIQFELGKYILFASLLFLVTIDLIKMYSVNKDFKRRKKANEKIFLFESIIKVTQHSYSVLILLNGYNMFHNWVENFAQLSIYKQCFLAGLLTVLHLFFYIINQVIPKNAEDLLKKTYPEYKLIKNM